MNELKDKIVSSIKSAQEKGITLICEDWGSDSTKCACPLGCVLISNEQMISEDQEDNADTAADILGVSSSWINNFILGFDDESSSDDVNYDDAWELGCHIRNETNPTTHTDYVNSLDPMAVEFVAALEIK